MKTLWTFERSESIHPLNAAKPRTGLTKFEGDSIQHSIFENRKQHVASASVLLRNVCITSWTTISSSLSSSSIWILMMIESRVIEALFRSTLSLNQGSSSCRRPPNLISRLIGEEGGAIKFGNKIGPWLEKKLADQSNPENLRLDWSASCHERRLTTLWARNSSNYAWLEVFKGWIQQLYPPLAGLPMWSCCQLLFQLRCFGDAPTWRSWSANTVRSIRSWKTSMSTVWLPARSCQLDQFFFQFFFQI